MDMRKGQQQQTDGVKPKSERRLAAEASFRRAWSRVDMNDAELVAELREFQAKAYEGIEALDNGDYIEYTNEPFEKFLEDVKRASRERTTQNAKPQRRA